MDIIDLERQSESKADKNIYLYNPLKTDFTWKYDGVEYSIPAGENKAFKTHLANHLGKHLVDAYVNTKDKDYSRKKAEKLIYPE